MDSDTRTTLDAIGAMMLAEAGELPTAPDLGARDEQGRFAVGNPGGPDRGLAEIGAYRPEQGMARRGPWCCFNSP